MTERNALQKARIHRLENKLHKKSLENLLMERNCCIIELGATDGYRIDVLEIEGEEGNGKSKRRKEKR